MVDTPVKNYFGFTDESGNSRQERFFGLGLLVIDDEIGNFYDSMKPYYDKAFDNSKLIKSERIKNLKEQGEIDQIAEIANSSKRFELKFKNINYSNNLIYKSLVQEYFKFKQVRFCALVIDRKDPKFPRTDLEPWSVYIHRAAMLIANNVRNICPCNLAVLADDLTKPKNVTKTFEKSLNDAIANRLSKFSIKNPLVGITRLESHSSLMLQIVDILLGAVMYDFKKDSGLVSERMEERQGVVVEEVKNILNASKLSESKTYHKPNYFSVWQYQK